MDIYGEKIRLRALEERDNEMLRVLMNDPETEKMVFGTSWPVSESGQRQWLANLKNDPRMLRCAVEDVESGEAVGTLILSDIDHKNGTAELHIKLTGAARGKGIGTDCVKTIVRYAFRELRLNCVYANILGYNEASLKLFEKCGFVREGILRSRIFKGGRFVDVCVCSILAQDMSTL